MFPLPKLRELSPKTRLRKVARILQAVELELARTGSFDPGYLRELSLLVAGEASPLVRQDAAGLQQELAREGAPGAPGILRALNLLRNDILRDLNAEPAEWDFINPSSGLLSRSDLRVLPLRAYLEDIRSPYNVGSIFRTAEAFGAERILLSPRTPLPTHPRASKAGMRAEQAMPWQVADLAALRGSEGLFALELGGTPLDQFSFPISGTVLVGSEELGLSPEALQLADHGAGRVSIPLVGAKRSLNVAVSFGILMRAWRASLDPR
ncbi:MAG: TrmH family RNA methyltransferase [Spirochaetia bacterium]|jgi:TrmH family RNA methyltransferase